MITRIEIDGFKSFQDFALDLAPFQVIIGPNGCGKSNLFDAIQLLSDLADMPVNKAMQNARGDARELFSVLPDGTRAERMRFAVEIQVPPTVEDEFGGSAKIIDTTLRYEIEITRREERGSLDSIEVSFESLSPPYSRVFGESNETHNLIYIATKPLPEGGMTRLIYFKRDIEKNKRQNQSSISGWSRQRTLLSWASTVETEHLLTARQEMRSWYQLNPQVKELRSTRVSAVKPLMLENGQNLPATLARMQQDDPTLLRDVSFTMANLVPGVCNVEVEVDAEHDDITIYAKMKDGRRFSNRVLSDGTLRALALATMANEPGLHGTLCFEDPEMGVHPGALRKIVDLLRDMTAARDEEGGGGAQVLVTTHSPDMISRLDVSKELLFAEMVTRMEPGRAAMQVTRISPVCADGDEDKGRKAYTLSQVYDYLNNPDRAAVRDALRNKKK